MGCTTSKTKQQSDGDTDAPSRPLSNQADSSDVVADGAVDASQFIKIVLPSLGSIPPHAAKTQKGMVPYTKHKPNQDRALLHFHVRGESTLNLWGVMDGHGECGQRVSAFVQENLVSCLEAQSTIRAHPERALTDAVKKLCDDLTDTNINVAFSGSTLVCGFQVSDMLYVANVGDSRCVLCRQSDSGELQAIGLSIDQKPDNPREKARILKAGGRVQPLPGPPGEDCGPPRVWLAEVDVPGLAMCLKEGTMVALADGSAIPCQHIKTGMYLMGDQGQPVTVMDAQRNFSNSMYTVCTKHGQPYTVTSDHKLTLRWNDTGELFEMSAEKFAAQWDQFSKQTSGVLCNTMLRHIQPPSTPPSPTHIYSDKHSHSSLSTSLQSPFTSTPWLSLTKAVIPADCPVPIISLEVSGNHRYVLGDGSITHNSRSIGDEVSQTVGVLSVPEIIPHQIQRNDIFAIWATDGVWEFLSNEQAISIVWKYKHDLGEAAQQLIDEATKQWRKEEEVIDDITVVIVQFNEPKQ